MHIFAFICHFHTTRNLFNSKNMCSFRLCSMIEQINGIVFKITDLFCLNSTQVGARFKAKFSLRSSWCKLDPVCLHHSDPLTNLQICACLDFVAILLCSKIEFQNNRQCFVYIQAGASFKKLRFQHQMALFRTPKQLGMHSNL